MTSRKREEGTMMNKCSEERVGRKAERRDEEGVVKQVDTGQETRCQKGRQRDLE